MLNLKLNDTFTIANTLYRINTIKTNLLTNKSTLELYTLSESVSQVENGQSGFLPRVENFVSTGTTSSSISLEWDSLESDPNLLGYGIYKDGEFDNFNSPSDLTSAATGLESGVTYKISIEPRYLINGQDLAGIPTDLFETTD